MRRLGRFLLSVVVALALGLRGPAAAVVRRRAPRPSAARTACSCSITAASSGRGHDRAPPSRSYQGVWPQFLGIHYREDPQMRRELGATQQLPPARGAAEGAGAIPPGDLRRIDRVLGGLAAGERERARRAPGASRAHRPGAERAAPTARGRRRGVDRFGGRAHLRRGASRLRDRRGRPSCRRAAHHRPREWSPDPGGLRAPRSTNPSACSGSGRTSSCRCSKRHGSPISRSPRLREPDGCCRDGRRRCRDAERVRSPACRARSPSSSSGSGRRGRPAPGWPRPGAAGTSRRGPRSGGLRG